MSMSDPIADMLTRIRNAQGAKHPTVAMQASNMKMCIAKVLKEEGYIEDFRIIEESGNHKSLVIALKYYHDKPVIERIERTSKPGRRVYKDARELTKVPGFGIEILTTSGGVMTHQTARLKNIGGEVICEVA